jgi:hypothetical protein
MSIPLSVELKLTRVQEHIDALQGEIQMFLNKEPYSVRRVIEGNGSMHVFYWERYTKPPDRLGLIIGDAVHNLRSALDHVAVALAEDGAASEGIRMTERESRHIQFPIASSPDEFASQVRAGRLSHVKPAAQEQIERRQPYITASVPDNSILATLARLDNADKHHSLITAAHSTGIFMENWPTEVGHSPLQSPPPPWRYESGAELGRFVFAEPQPEANLPVTVAFGIVIPEIRRPENVDDLLRTFLAAVVTTSIRPLCSTFLP